MSLADWFLPTPAKQQEQMTTVIAKQIMAVMSSSKFSSGSAITQRASISASGNAKITNSTIMQAATINTAAFLSDQTNLQLQSDLKDSLKNTIANQASNMPLGKEPNVNTKIASVVDKSIEQNFKYENMVQLNQSANQVADITAVNSGQISGGVISQRADVIAKFTNQVARDIASQLISTTDVTNTSDTKTTNFIAETVTSFGNAISGLFTGILSSPVMMVVAVIAVIMIAIIVRQRANQMGPMPGMIMPPMSSAPLPASPPAPAMEPLPPVGSY
jgi:hypothetical protein